MAAVYEKFSGYKQRLVSFNILIVGFSSPWASGPVQELTVSEMIREEHLVLH